MLDRENNLSDVFPEENLKILFGKTIFFFVILSAKGSTCSGHIPVSPPSMQATALPAPL